MTSNKVSVIIPAYNCEKYIEQCIDSVYKQTHKNIEVICLDNESKDNTYNVIKKIKLEKYNNLIIDIVPNIYPNCWDECRDKALSIMSGDYFCMLASDDFFDEKYIENNIKIFEENKEVEAIQSYIANIKDNKFAGFSGHNYSSLNDFKTKLIQKCVVNSPTVFYKRSLFEKKLVKTNPVKYSGAADYDMFCNLANNNVFILPVQNWLGYCYRWHENQATWQMHKSNINYDILIQDFWRKEWNL